MAVSTERTLHLDRTALLLHCLQNDLVKGAGPPYRMGPDQVRLLQNTARILERARSLGLPVVHAALFLGPDERDFPFPATDMPFSFPFVGSYLRPGTPGAAFVDELQPRAGEPVVHKIRFGAFYQTPLEHLLRARGIDTLLIAGLYAELGVEMTVREAWDRGFHVVVLSDCCDTLAPHTWERLMGELLPRFARVRGSAEVLSLLAQ